MVVKNTVWKAVSSGGGARDTAIGDPFGLGEFEDVTAMGSIGMLGIIVEDTC